MKKKGQTFRQHSDEFKIKAVLKYIKGMSSNW